MANEIQRWYFGSQASPILPVAGDYYFSANGDPTNTISWNADSAAITAAFEADPSLGAGSVSITATIVGGDTVGWQVEFVGAFANTNIPLMSLGANALKQAANTVTINVDQSGIADVAVTPSNNTTTAALTPTQEVASLSLGAAPDAGDLVINGITVANGSSFAAADVEAAIEDAGGANTPCSVSGSQTALTITYDAYADISDTLLDFTGTTLSVSSSPLTPSYTVTTQGVAGVHQVDTCTFDGTATGGSMALGGHDLAWDSAASSLQGSIFAGGGGTLSSGTPNSGSFTTIWDDYTTHTPLAVTSGTLKIVGRLHIFTVTLSDSPTEGSAKLIKGGSSTGEWAYNADTAAVESAIEAIAGGYPCAVTGSAGGPWTVTSDDNVAPTWTGAEGSTPLRKALGLEIVAVQDVFFRRTTNIRSGSRGAA